MKLYAYETGFFFSPKANDRVEADRSGEFPDYRLRPAGGGRQDHDHLQPF
jgi:hypothetical protein